MTARLFREGDVVIGRFGDRVRWAEVWYLDRHSDSLRFIDLDGYEITEPLHEFTTVETPQSRARGASCVR